MFKLIALLALFSQLLFSQNAPSQNTAPAKDPGTATLSGRWVVTVDFFGTPDYSTLHLTQTNGKLSGDFDGDKLDGTAEGKNVHFLAKDEHGGSEEVKGAVEPDAKGLGLKGTITYVDAQHPGQATTQPFTAILTSPARNLKPQRHEFVPTVFYRQFSAANKPVLTINPGDTVHTTTVDAGGTDEKNTTRVLGGNPETGPFYVETAQPGDTLAIHFNRIRLNRDWAISDDALVGRALDTNWAVKMKDAGQMTRWHIDREKGIASPDKPSEHLAHYSVPVRPMLGCVAVAPAPAQGAPGANDSGGWGGNMDFNEVAEDATVYLPVRTPGAYLYIGDGHAVQGDGELNGNALETSMEVEFTVNVVSEKSIPGPRVESSTHLMAMGLAGSVDDALRAATANMGQWLTDDYKLTPGEVAQVLGTSAEYKLSEVADRNAGIVLKINKDRLRALGESK